MSGEWTAKVGMRQPPYDCNGCDWCDGAVIWQPCKAGLMVKGEHFPCDWPTSKDGTHSGWAHANRDAEAVWRDGPEPNLDQEWARVVRGRHELTKIITDWLPTQDAFAYAWDDDDGQVRVDGDLTPAHLADAIIESAWAPDDPAALAEIAMLRRGGKTLGEIIDRQGRELIELTDSQDVIGDDGDGDWAVVWDRLHDMKRQRDAFAAEVREQRGRFVEFADAQAQVRELTRQLESARALAVRSGIFESDTP